MHLIVHLHSKNGILINLLFIRSTDCAITWAGRGLLGITTGELGVRLWNLGQRHLFFCLICLCYFCAFTWFLFWCHLILRSFWHAFWATILWFSNVIVQRVPKSHFYGFLMLLFKEFPNPIFMIFWCYCSNSSQIPFLWFSDFSDLLWHFHKFFS